MPRTDVNVLMVFPRFSPNSFWNYWETCAVAGRKYSAAPLGLITVAALLPDEWTVRLVDRNIEELPDADLDWADLVMIGGMMPQQADTKQVIALAHAHGKPVVLGGPDVSCNPSVFEEVEFRILGEVDANTHRSQRALSKAGYRPLARCSFVRLWRFTYVSYRGRVRIGFWSDTAPLLIQAPE